MSFPPKYSVAPYTGAWIEILYIGKKKEFTKRSLLIQERGLKFLLVAFIFRALQVAPYTGAWIEILTHLVLGHGYIVAPYTGAWIEIVTFFIITVISAASLLIQERGLKSFAIRYIIADTKRRSLYRSVD